MRNFFLIVRELTTKSVILGQNLPRDPDPEIPSFVDSGLNALLMMTAFTVVTNSLSSTVYFVTTYYFLLSQERTNFYTLCTTFKHETKIQQAGSIDIRVGL